MARQWPQCKVSFFPCAAVPLYQEYCLQEVKDNLHGLGKSSVSELLPPQYLQALQSRLGSPCHSEAAPPQLEPLEANPLPPVPHPTPRVTPGTLWQDLDEVKASDLLGSMTPRDIRLQEVVFLCSIQISPRLTTIYVWNKLSEGSYDKNEGKAKPAELVSLLNIPVCFEFCAWQFMHGAHPLFLNLLFYFLDGCSHTNVSLNDL